MHVYVYFLHVCIRVSLSLEYFVLKTVICLPSKRVSYVIYPLVCVYVRADIDDCANMACMNGGTCQDLVDDYRCLCAAGYTGSNCSVGE